MSEDYSPYDNWLAISLEDYKKTLTKEQKWDYMFSKIEYDCKKCVCCGDKCGERSYCRNPQYYRYMRGLY